MNLRTNHEALPIYGEAGLFSIKIIERNKSRGRRDGWGKKIKNVLTSGQRCGTIIVECGMNCNINKRRDEI